MPANWQELIAEVQVQWGGCKGITEDFIMKSRNVVGKQLTFLLAVTLNINV